MTIARKEMVDLSLTRWYHCITRCVRRAFLLGEGLLDRKQWVEDRVVAASPQAPKSCTAWQVQAVHCLAKFSQVGRCIACPRKLLWAY